MPPRRLTLLGAGLALPALLTLPARAAPAEVTANEDLMREHGALRRILIIYRELAPRLRGDGPHPDPAVIDRLATLFHRFGQDYHERLLEEQQIFPLLERQGGSMARLVATLRDQHRRGREVTAFIQASARTGPHSGAQRPLADALDAMARMYEAHATREDTELFPSFREALSEAQYKEMGEKFEQLEQHEFGHDGFEDALKQVQQAEQALGLADLGAFTAPPPPASPH